MSLTDWDRDNCAVERTLSVIGDRKTLLVLREAFLGVRRFDQLRRNTGLARNILSDRLNTLVANGILRRELYQERPPRHEYRLTRKGVDLYPVLITLMEWGTRYGEIDEPAILLEHRSCGAIMMPRLACPECGEPLTAHDVRAVPGPGATLREIA
ncbi:MAG: helix-turn-helix transcriptional regulator [Actinomycetota bacterium]|nr:helix-turn-helix transcriptional regulator [Actinomycetota bacterium]